MKRTLAIGLLLSFFTGATAAAEEQPGRLKILGLSLLLPGLGHRALGHHDRALGFLSAEAAIWGTFAVFETQGEIRKDSYIEMAELFAGVRDASGLSDEYYRLVGRYPSSDLYDDEIRRDARARYGDDLEARAEYFERHRIRGEQTWNWASAADRRRYRDKRNESNQAFKRAGYMVGVAVANRLLAAVDAMRLVHKRDGGTAMGFSIVPGGSGSGGPTLFCVSVRFP